MALTAVNFVTKGPVLHQDLLQFYNLFTGVMTDQPITFQNTLSVGGQQGTSTVPLKVFGATGQTTHLLDLYGDHSQSQPGWGMAALGQMGWGPGGTGAQDTFLSRVATQNGHSSDTAGLLASPYLEVAGGIGFNGALNFLGSGATISQGGAGSLEVIVNQDLLVNRRVYLTDANARIRHFDETGNTGISIESPNNLFGGMSSSSAYLGSNTYWSQPNGWQAFNTANAAALVSVTYSSGIVFSTAPAASGVQTYTNKFTVDVGGTGTFAGDVHVNSGNLYVVGPSSAGSVTIGDASVQRWNANQLRFTGSAGTTSAGQMVVEAGGVDVTGASTFLGNVNISGSNALIFSVNGYGWNGVSGQTVVQTGGSVVVNAGSLYLDSSMNNRLYWDGVGFHFNKALTCDSSIISLVTGIYSRDGTGNYYSGPTDATVFGVWNPGQLRIKSGASADLLAAGQITAEGGPVTGKGAYINSASSETVKTNIVELSPSTCLARVLDPQMRPVQFEYTTSIAYGAVATEAPDPNAEMPQWTDERLGFISEEVNRVVPEAVGMLESGVAHGYQEGALLPVLWGAIRALEARIKTLEGAAA